MNLKTPMRYPGAKNGLFTKVIVPAIEQFVPKQCVYVEPFAGGLSTVCGFTNAFSPRRIILNDLDKGNYAIYRCIADGKLAKRLATMAKATAASVDEHARQKSLLESTDTLERAFAVLYLGRTTFRAVVHEGGPVGGYKQDGKGDRIGRWWKGEEVARTILDLHDAIGSIMEPSNRDFEAVIRKNDKPGTVIYLDPPYYKIGERLYSHDMADDADHVRLAQVLRCVKHAFVVLSYGEHPRIRELYEGIPIRVIENRQSVCSNGKARKSTPELLMLINGKTAKSSPVSPPPVKNTMSPTEKATLAARLQKSEAKIERGLTAFVEVGRELRRIRDERLYRGADDTTFDAYVERRWKMTKSHAYRFITAATCHEHVSKLGTPILPKTESQVRPMASLPAPKQQEVWREVLASTKGEQPTAKQVEAAVAKVTGRKVTPTPKPPSVVRLASVMCRLGYDASLSLSAARIADEFMRNAFIIEGNDNLKADIELDKLALVLRAEVDRCMETAKRASYGCDGSDREETGLHEILRRHGEWLCEAAEDALDYETTKN